MEIAAERFSPLFFFPELQRPSLPSRMWPGPRERGGGDRWIEKEAGAGRGGGREREGKRAVSGGERAQLMMKQGRAGVRAHCTFSSSARRAHAQGGVGRGHSALLRRRVTANTHK